MKTAKEWFETLPEPYRTQAIENSTAKLLKSPCISLIEAISCSFTWEKTDQGPKYWLTLIDKLDAGTIKLNTDEDQSNAL